MFALRRSTSRLYPTCIQYTKTTQLSDSYGAGKGSGTAGSIRDAGGAFGKRQAVQEEEFFYKRQKEAVQQLKDDKIRQLEFHEQRIKEHMKAIERHKLFLRKEKE